MIELLLHPIATHIIAFIAGNFFNIVVLHRYFSRQEVKIDLGSMFRVSIMLGVLLFYLGSLYNSQFNEGSEPGLVFSLMGAFSFGSLVGEKTFFTDLISAFNKKK